MDLLIWIITGLVAGVLAALVVGSAGYGVIGDLVVGMVGAFLGGWLFREMHWRVPFAGIAGAITVAFVGAVILLVLLHVVRRLQRPPSPSPGRL